jgi:hypothetical protein
MRSFGFCGAGSQLLNIKETELFELFVAMNSGRRAVPEGFGAPEKKRSRVEMHYSDM